jgi:mono/diheme cytochrome c family protein
MRIPLLSLPTFLLAAGWAHAQSIPGNPIAGEQLARLQCAECHLLPGGARATASGIPSFQAIASEPRVTALSLNAFLQTPHDRMPNIMLTRREIDDLVAYILSFKSR